MRSRANAQVNFQRRHFEFMARTIADYYGTNAERSSVAEHFANRLTQTNPYFDRDKFIQWAMGDERSQSDIDHAEREQRKHEREMVRAAKAVAKAEQAKAKAEIKYYEAVTGAWPNTTLAGVGKTEKLGG